MHIYHQAKLHKIQDVRRISRLLGNDVKALNAFGDALYSAGKHLEAAHYYEQANSNEHGVLTKKARSLFMGGETQKSLEVLNSAPDKSSLTFQEVLLDCMRVTDPQSGQIPLLDRRVLRLKVENSLDNEISAQAHGDVIQPVVHGDD
jgi:hypothetical protein